MAYNSLEPFMGFWSYIVMAIVMLVAFFIHEFSKVVIANILSDRAVTVGVPLKRFIEPIGFCLMYFFGVGWANSATINPLYFNNRKRDVLLVYLGAVCTSLLIGAGLLMLSFNFMSSYGLLQMQSISFIIWNIVAVLGKVSVAVAIMNLIPMIPFSGYYILYELVSPNVKMSLINNRNIIQVIVLMLLFFGQITKIINMVLNVVLNLVV